MKATKIFFLSSLLIILFISFALSNIVNGQDNQTNLIAHWSFDEGYGNIAYDSSGNGHNGTINGATWTTGISGSCLQFNGVDNYVDIPNSPSLNGLETISISCWFYVEGFDIWEPILNKGGYNEYQTDVFEVNINNQGLIHFVLNFETSGRQGYNSPTGTVVLKEWHHFVGTYDGDFVKIYLDGEEVASYDAPNERLQTSDSTLQIGLEYDNPPENYYNGKIDEIYIYSTAIDANNVGNLHLLTDIDIHTCNPCIKENKAAERSIFNNIVRKPFIPVIATVSSIILLIIWNLFGNILVEFLSDYTSEKIIDKKDELIKKTKKKASYLPVTYSEIISIIIAIIVFSLVLSWTWSATFNEFALMFLINFVIVGSIFAVKELYRIQFSKKNKIKTEHIFWPFGAFLTILSTFLGNTFSMASYIKGEDESDKKYAKMLFNSFILLYIISIATFLLNLLISSVILQMIFVFTIMIIVIDMVPISPMDGKFVFKWNKNYWIGFYAIVVISYIIMNFNNFL